MTEAPRIQDHAVRSNPSAPSAPDPASLESTPGQDALRALLRASGTFRRIFDPHLGQFGLTGCQWGVLRALARHEARGLPPMRMSDVGLATCVQPPSMSATLSRMEKLGLIERRTDPSDSRGRLVLLTDHARRAMTRVMTVHDDWIARVTSALSPEECAELNRLLTRLANHMGTVDVARAAETETSESCDGSDGEAGPGDNLHS